jgi:hypothetical protein
MHENADISQGSRFMIEFGCADREQLVHMRVRASHARLVNLFCKTQLLSQVNVNVSEGNRNLRQLGPSISFNSQM